MLQDLFQYNHDINIKMIEKCIEHRPELNKKIYHLFSHIINAHQIWNTRIINEIENTFEVFQIHQIENWSTLNKINFEYSERILADENVMNSNVSYTNSKGENHQNQVRDILFHVINHSNYHRAQINTELVKLQIKPVLTDYIFYKRS